VSIATFWQPLMLVNHRPHPYQVCSAADTTCVNPGREPVGLSASGRGDHRAHGGHATFLSVGPELGHDLIMAAITGH
jgi:hypothetical protein